MIQFKMILVALLVGFGSSMVQADFNLLAIRASGLVLKQRGSSFTTAGVGWLPGVRLGFFRHIYVGYTLALIPSRFTHEAKFGIGVGF